MNDEGTSLVACNPAIIRFLLSLWMGTYGGFISSPVVNKPIPAEFTVELSSDGVVRCVVRGRRRPLGNLRRAVVNKPVRLLYCFNL
jgi:hypothetical protein